MKRNLQHIDEVRFLVIHIILINHWSLNLYITNTPIDQTLINYYFELTSPTLALISGYLFFYKTKEQFNYLKKLKTRFHSLVVPYLFWTITFYFVYLVVKEEYLRIFHHTVWYAPVQAFGLKSFINNLINPPLVNFWYLQNLVLVLPFNFLIYYLLKNKYVFLVFFLLIISIYAFKWFDPYLQARFLPFYLIGSYFGYNEKHIPRVHFSKLLTFIAIPVLWIIADRTHDEVIYQSLPGMILKIAVVAIFSFCVYNMLDSNQDGWVFRYLKKYKDYSFFLFAINMFLFSTIQRTLLFLGAAKYLNNMFFALFFLMLSYVLVILVAFTLAGFLKRRASRFYSIITGR